VHPLVRDAVYKELSPAHRELMHSRAAELLRDAGEPPDQVASHLLSMPRRGEEWVVKVLIQAAHAATRRSAPESAATYLTRALDEPPPAAMRAEMLLELGIAGTNTYGPDAIGHLREAYDLLEDPHRRALAAFVLARTLMFAADPDAAAAFARRAAEDLPDECSDERQALIAVELSSANFNARVENAPERVLALSDERFGDRPGARMLASAIAFGLMRQGRSRERAVELALHALEDGALYEADNGLFWMGAILALANADHPDTPALWAETMDHAHRNGSLFSQLSMSLWDGASSSHRASWPRPRSHSGRNWWRRSCTASSPSRLPPTRSASSAARCWRARTCAVHGEPIAQTVATRTGVRTGGQPAVPPDRRRVSTGAANGRACVGPPRTTTPRQAGQEPAWVALALA
jgi:hypothetical protein